MKVLDYVPVKLTLFLVLGILIEFYTNIPLFIVAGIAFVLFILLTISWLKKNVLENRSFGILTAFLVIAIGMLATALSLPDNNSSHYTNFSLEKEQYILLKVRNVLKPTNYNDRFIADIIEIDGVPALGKVLLITKKDSLSYKFKVDDEFYTLNIPVGIKQPLNPHEFDYARYMKNLGVVHQIKVDHWNYTVKKEASISLLGLSDAFRQKIISRLLKANFGQNELGVIQALLLGQRNEINEQVYTNYKNAGAVHILAVSGLHIGIVLLLCQYLLQPLERLPKGKTIVLLLTVILLWAYALLAGLSPSVIRAVTMFSFVAYAMSLKRPTSTFNILALSMFFLLLVYNPMLLFQVGFQLSYAAVFGIFWIYPKLQRFWNPKTLILKKTWQLLSVSIAAQIGVLPISLYYFHQFPALFFISNLLIVPFLGLILGMGFLIIILSLANLLPDELSSIYNRLIHLINRLIEWVAQQESFIIRDITFDMFQVILSYLLIFALVSSLNRRKFTNILATAVCIITMQIGLITSISGKGKEHKIMVLHKTGTSAILYRRGLALDVYSSDSSKVTNLVKNFVIKEKIKKLNYKTLKNSYQLKQQYLYVLNRPEVHGYNLPKIEYLLIGNSPKINLNRFLDSIETKSVIADGSNYFADIRRWQKTCAERKLPFYYTGENGAFIMDIE